MSDALKQLQEYRGSDTETMLLIERIDSEIERLNQMLRETGCGQGSIDAYVAQCEEVGRLRALHAEIVGELYGQGFFLTAADLFGDLKKLDRWFEDNGWLDIDNWHPKTSGTREG